MPPAHTTAPMALAPMNLRASILPTPAITGTKVRTMGTNLAITNALVPYRSKNTCVRATLRWLNQRESGRSNTAGPNRRPIMYPTWLPTNAAMASTGTTERDRRQMWQPLRFR